ncbi:MAG: hypothetical protein ACD_2C00144G0006 [uncultured bacterium (gcode 4)]|uniref:Uncharacterized protein n=1 Tax=uncultured bacterium (gcode 4) TaxID=1234023 RepID=K2FEG5_9BACT|nr:MAG: hypothetical protein ACD_2C00144G0006 [uncultured bacterium (gcode 4)]
MPENYPEFTNIIKFIFGCMIVFYWAYASWFQRYLSRMAKAIRESNERLSRADSFWNPLLDKPRKLTLSEHIWIKWIILLIIVWILIAFAATVIIYEADWVDVREMILSLFNYYT